MIVTVISRTYIKTITLPQKVAGQYWLYCKKDDGAERLISIEGINDEWILKSNRQVSVLDDKGSILKSTIIVPLCIYTLSKSDGERIYVFTEPMTENRQVFTKYLVKSDMAITIGRGEENDIWFENAVVSKKHVSLFYKEGKWSLQDEKSGNGTFVNEKRVVKDDLKFGDIVFVMGLKIIVGKNFVAINNPDNQVQISEKFIKFVNQEIESADEDEEYELVESNCFYRSPRFKRDIKTAIFKVDSPPNSPISEEMPWLLVMGSSLSMGMMSFVTLLSAIATKNVTSMVMGGSMLVGTLLLPTITKSYEKNRKRKKEELRQKKYREYLDKVTVQINEQCRLQEEILHENNVTIRECEMRIQDISRNLWERTKGQNDFLKVRVGHGDGVLDAEISYQERKFLIDEDNLQEELYMLCERPKKLHDVPITYSLYENYISGIIGERKQVTDFAKGLIFQLTSLYSYDEVKLVFLVNADEVDDFAFVRWLPHVWSDDGKFRLVATNIDEAKEVSAYMENVISIRLGMNENDLEEVSPHYVIFSMSKELAIRTEMLKRIFSKKRNLSISVVTLHDELRNLPKECSIVVELDNGNGRIFDKNDVSGKSTVFTPDIMLTQNPLELSVQLANIPLDVSSANIKLPKMITFLEMFGVGKVEHLNSLTRWKENNPTKSLETAIGVDTLGEPFKLDLHERFHGPHGLVAGMTGSGKSEFIMTYILSLAVNYHPNEVAFVLIDYKGGGMAKAFEKLPHTAGIITNLDGAAIKRSLVSIESELKRRQAIFNEAAQRVGVSNVDIYKYQKLFREGTVSEPLQHLFIISDEFAELKTQQPEFMTQLVSAARIGRSLGVHLILATQKPSGVVDDQIWSNSKFKICLKVQERADSMDMLKRPDAAELTDTGRFYLQVGYNELFEMGQSAWAGASYHHSDKVLREKDRSIVVVDMNGHVIKEVKPDKRKFEFIGVKKQLDVITEYLKRIADEERIKIRPLWLEPIPAVILLEDVKKKYGAISERFKLNPIIGEYDDPVHQRQCVFRLPISKEGNVVVYGAAGSGKTSFLNAMFYSLIQEHSPDELNIYMLDFASETLKVFAKAPHVGDVILSYEAEKVSNLFKILQSEVEQRKKLFVDYGGDYTSYIKNSDKTLPSIVVAIQNFAAFTEMYEEKEEVVAFLSREGTKYGLYFVLTVLGTGGVRFRLLQNFKQLLVLQLNDESDYSSVVGKTEGLYPSKYKGRGLMKTDALYEFQVASLTKDSLPFMFVQEMCMELGKSWDGAIAKKIPILPDRVSIEFLRDYVRTDKKWSIPIGVEKNTLKVHYYPFGDSYINMIMSAGNDYQKFVSELSVLMGMEINANGIIFDVPRTISAETGTLSLIHTAKDCEREVSKLFDLLVYRNNTFKKALEEESECEKFEDIVVIINSLSSLKGILEGESNEKLSLILERGTINYNVIIIVGENEKAIPTVSYENWYKVNVSTMDGIWVGNGITEQYQMKTSKTTSEMHEDITSEFGYSLIKGKAVKIKLLRKETEDEEDE